MSTSPNTPIEFYHRPPERPTTYRWLARLVDHWRGRRDGRFLSASQAEEASPRGTSVGDVHDLVPTPWVRARVAEVEQVDAREHLTLERVLDALLRERQRLTAETEALDARHTELSTAATTLTDQGPGSSAPRGAGEALESVEERFQRRIRTHAAEAAAMQRQLATLQQRRSEAHVRISELDVQITNAERTCERRRLDARAHAERRVATYARGMQRVAPTARLVQALAGRPLFSVPRPLPALHAAPTASTAPTP